MKFGITWLGILVIGVLFVVETNAKLVQVDENNWESLLSKNEWMVEFFAPWCPACNRFESTWKEFADKSNELRINVGSADVSANPVLSGLFSITSLPTVYHIKDGQYRIYNGNRDLNSLVDFIRNQEWQKIEPSSSWLSPNSFLIKILSVLFKITLYFKDLYTQLTEKYGLPSWVAIGIFVVVTIILGLFLGVVLILFLDCLCPPKKYSAEEIKEMNDGIEEDVDSGRKKDSADRNEEQDDADKDDQPSDKPVRRRQNKPKKDN